MASNWGGIISTALAGASGLIENLWGTSMEDEARKKEAALGDAPKFAIPDSQIAFEEGMRKRMGKNMPGYSQMESDINSTAATSMGASARVSGSQVGAMGGANRSMASRKRQLRQLGVANLQSQDTAKLQYGEAVKSRGQYEQAQFEYNEWLPWQIQKNEIAAIRGSGQQRLMSGLDQAAATGIYASSLFGNQNQNTPPPTPVPSPYDYGAAGQSITQMGQNQMSPGYGQTGNMEPWMTGTW